MAYIFRGTNGSDKIYGSRYDDDIYGYGGNDLLVGGAGNDRLYGGAGADDLVGGSGFNDYVGGSGADWFIMSARGGAFSNDLIWDFEFGADRIDVSAWGISDFSQLRAILGADSYGDATLNAFYAGRDHKLTLDGVAPSELISSDFVYAGGGARDMAGTGYDDMLFGSRFGDTIRGGGGDDVILGGQGNDRLYGGAGNDDLVGGAGKDFLWGGAGSDAFVFDFASESAPGAGRDVIMDFQQGRDFIDLDLMDANALLSGDQDFAFIGRSGFSAPGQVRYSHVNGTTIVAGNLDGDAAPEFQIELNGIYFLTASDFDL
ncbi:calcium-binding protein [Lutibaculum baratangense]|uniref:Alkaline phosphatase n=1 Tax=Lutibaculum baratangense AMV1 TaxID=631454 RepID=V4RMA9_9HYPH|nr:M10 family metallopeptidase C-terminal domain-containing protein [Lutibaculum baratangense]ESR27161.1 Alkaline phosphatase [Lutibaculum baratangense AMV1]